MIESSSQPIGTQAESLCTGLSQQGARYKGARYKGHSEDSGHFDHHSPQCQNTR
jgi:hypothetical protein